MASPHAPAVGFGFRAEVDGWTMENLARFDVLEITVDHVVSGGRTNQALIYDLVGRIPLTAHGVGLSIGTDLPLDTAYLDAVAAAIEKLGAPAYSEHLAFTRVPGRDLANLLPLPRTFAVAEAIVDKVRRVQARVPVPFLLENIANIFEWPDSEMSEAEFLSLICRESGAGVLLDVENLYVNRRNHDADPYDLIDRLPPGAVREIHVAGGIDWRPNAGWQSAFFADSHSHPAPREALDLLAYALQRHKPAAIILERDNRLEFGREILDDIDRIRACVARNKIEPAHAAPPAGSTD